MTLTIQQLKTLSSELHLNLGQSELHYMHTLFLFSVSKLSPHTLVFKGGTSLMICYNLDRFSEDLDFNIVEEIDINKLLTKIVSFFKKIGYESSFSFKRKTHSSQTYMFYIQGPLYMGKPESQTTFELDFSNREDIYLQYIPKKVHHIFDEFPQFYINTLSLEEICAEKFRCILTREKARDVYDLYYLLQRNTTINRDLINKKLQIYSLTYNQEMFIQALKKKEQIWSKELSNLLTIVPAFEEIVGEIIEHLTKKENEINP